MACDSVRRLCVRWCGQLVGCSGSGRGGHMKFKDSITLPGTSREVRSEMGLRPRFGWVIPWDRKKPGDFRGRQKVQCDWVEDRSIVWKGQTVKDSVGHTQELHITPQVLGNHSGFHPEKS